MLNKLKEEFLETLNDGSKVNYKRKLEIFLEYLINECGVCEKNYEEVLRSIGLEKIIKSVEYYVHNYGIKFKSTIDNYITVQKLFFDFLAQYKELKNKLFDSQVNKNKLDKNIKEKVQELSLNEKKIKEPIGNEDFARLLKVCDEIIHKYNLEDVEKDKTYKPLAARFISAIMMKLAMYTGIKNSVFGTILKSDYDFNYNTIKINGIDLKLPVNLAYDMKKYYDFRKGIIKAYNIKDEDSNLLFINYTGEFLNKPSSEIIYRVMRDEFGSLEGETLTKYVIMNLIMSGIETLSIVELTKTSIVTCDYCREQGLERGEDEVRKDLSKKMKVSNLYDLL